MGASGYCGLFGKSALTQQGVGSGTVTAHGLEQHHGIFRGAAFENGFQFGGSGGIEHTVLLEHLESVGIKHLGPQICVIA